MVHWCAARPDQRTVEPPVQWCYAPPLKFTQQRGFHVTQTVLTVASRKGGVGKTSAAVHLAATLGRRGADVVLVDLDSQANATTILTQPDSLPDGAPTTAEVLAGDRPLAETLVATTSPGVRLAPASARLIAAQLMVLDRPGREFLLRRALEGLQADAVVIDTGPDGGLAVANALVASTHVLVPFTADPLALSGLLAIEALVAQVQRQYLNPGLQILGALEISAHRRVQVAAELRDQAARHLGPALFETRVRENAKFRACSIWHQDVSQLEHGADRRGTADYEAVTDECQARLAAARAPRRRRPGKGAAA